MAGNDTPRCRKAGKPDSATKRRIDLYLSEEVIRFGDKFAAEVYGESLSRLVERTLRDAFHRKRQMPFRGLPDARRK